MANNVTGINDVIKLLEKVEKAPAKTLTISTKKGANIIKNQAKSDAPKETGALRRSIKIRAEKRRNGKKVYQVKFIGENLAKVSADGKRSFYPASQEYGWTDKNGKRHLGTGKKFLRNALEDNRESVKQTILDEMAKSLREVK